MRQKVTDTHRQFMRTAAACGVDGRILLGMGGELQMCGDIAIGHHTPVFVGHVITAKLLREGADQPFAAQMLPLDEFADDTASLALARTLNATRLRYEARPASEVRMGHRPIWACRSTEAKFADTVNKPNSGRNGADIFMDNNNKPVLLRKAFGRPLALGLREIVVGGIPLPAGMLYNVQATGDVPGFNGGEEPYVNPARVTVRPWSTVETVSPVRLCMYGIPGAERAEHLDEGVAVPSLEIADINQMVVDMAQNTQTTA